MKLITCMISLYIGFFIAVLSLPALCGVAGLVETEVCGKGCSSDMQGSHRKKPAQSAENNGCDSCSSLLSVICFGFYEASDTVSFTQWAFEVESCPFSASNTPSACISECWQPPEPGLLS